MVKTERQQEIKNQCISYYQGAAVNYDSIRFSCECNNIYDRIAKETVYRYLKDNNNVLDAGTGTGRFAIYLAQMGLNVVAMDTSPEMIKIARNKAQELGCQHRIQFVVADIENLPFKATSFDGFCSIIVLIHFAFLDQAVSELARILKPGGVAVLDTPSKVLSRAYQPLVRLLGKTTFRDYHYDLKQMNRLLKNNSLEIVAQKGFGKLPRLFLHLFLCTFRFKFLGKIIVWFEEFNFGGTSIIKALKSQ